MFGRRRASGDGFGQIPDIDYFHGDMDYIRSYHEHMRAARPEVFALDDITWNDLDMDRVFRRINPRRCSSGEQVLYHMLRSPAISQDAYEARWRLVHYAEANPERRLRLETILARLGCTRRADLYRIFAPEAHGIGRLLVYLCCLLLLVFTVAAAVLPMGLDIRAVLLALLLNFYVLEFGKRKSQRDY
ncbi:MAG: hypothetical protein IJ048_14195, partial [Clostridia bacterium]|nr:hypothetical protein [Clostridia bacterium]